MQDVCMSCSCLGSISANFQRISLFPASQELLGWTCTLIQKRNPRCHYATAVLCASAGGSGERLSAHLSAPRRPARAARHALQCSLQPPNLAALHGAACIIQQAALTAMHARLHPPQLRHPACPPACLSCSMQLMLTPLLLPCCAALCALCAA